MKTIEDAVKDLSIRQAYQIKRAFDATGNLDIYDGSLTDYLINIAYTLEIKNKQLLAAEEKFRTIIEIIEYKDI